MRSLVFALVLLLLGTATPFARASDCSATQVAAIRALDTNATAVCGGSVLTPGAASVICANPACLAFIVSLGPQVPFCEIAGVNLRTVFAFAGSLCADQSNATDAVSYTKPPGSAATATARSSAAAMLVFALLASLALML
ncbi:hypothetical protein PybrP1_013215 [[Pythium] brassicae (nom. inval.)]|nr:hypothetical protein PybrP1_013215 [[Pythium] brassicae (nom. inval.)]